MCNKFCKNCGIPVFILATSKAVLNEIATILLHENHKRVRMEIENLMRRFERRHYRIFLFELRSQSVYHEYPGIKDCIKDL